MSMGLQTYLDLGIERIGMNLIECRSRPAANGFAHRPGLR